MFRTATIQPKGEFKARVYCPMCTHTVDAQARMLGKVAKVRPGQKCPRCSSALDAGVVMYLPQAA